MPIRPNPSGRGRGGGAGGSSGGIPAAHLRQGNKADKGLYIGLELAGAGPDWQLKKVARNPTADTQATYVLTAANAGGRGTLTITLPAALAVGADGNAWDFRTEGSSDNAARVDMAARAIIVRTVGFSLTQLAGWINAVTALNGAAVVTGNGDVSFIGNQIPNSADFSGGVSAQPIGAGVDASKKLVELRYDNADTQQAILDAIGENGLTVGDARILAAPIGGTTLSAVPEATGTAERPFTEYFSEGALPREGEDAVARDAAAAAQAAADQAARAAGAAGTQADNADQRARDAAEATADLTNKSRAGDNIQRANIATGSALQNALLAQVQASTALLLVFTAEVTHSGVTYAEGLVAYVPPASSVIENLFTLPAEVVSRIEGARFTAPLKLNQYRFSGAGAGTFGRDVNDVITLRLKADDAYLGPSLAQFVGSTITIGSGPPFRATISAVAQVSAGVYRITTMNRTSNVSWAGDAALNIELSSAITLTVDRLQSIVEAGPNIRIEPVEARTHLRFSFDPPSLILQTRAPVPAEGSDNDQFFAIIDGANLQYFLKEAGAWSAQSAIFPIRGTLPYLGRVDIEPSNIAAAADLEADYQVTLALTDQAVADLTARNANYVAIWFGTTGIHVISPYAPALASKFDVNINATEAAAIGLTNEAVIPVRAVFYHNDQGAQTYVAEIGTWLTIGGVDHADSDGADAIALIVSPQTVRLNEPNEVRFELSFASLPAGATHVQVGLIGGTTVGARHVITDAERAAGRIIVTRTWPANNAFVRAASIGFSENGATFTLYDQAAGGNAIATYNAGMTYDHGRVQSRGDVSGNVAVDVTYGETTDLTLTGNITVTLNAVRDGTFAQLRIKQDATGGRTLTLGAGITRNGLDAPVLSTGAGDLDLVMFQRIGSAWHYMGIIKDV